MPNNKKPSREPHGWSPEVILIVAGIITAINIAIIAIRLWQL